ncbi:MAG: hypothetical protein JWM99_3422 [Verrucomicrobiales bacterium]|nr:hypothetical protein [Verrucomicrobiales bacterium]
MKINCPVLSRQPEGGGGASQRSGAARPMDLAPENFNAKAHFITNRSLSSLDCVDILYGYHSLAVARPIFVMSSC